MWGAGIAGAHSTTAVVAVRVRALDPWGVYGAEVICIVVNNTQQRIVECLEKCRWCRAHCLLECF